MDPPTPPVSAHHKGYHVELEAGKRYAWCSCGRSAKQPFCDGTHRGSAFLPVMFTAPRNEDSILCGCKHSKSPPYCDGTHNNLPGGAAADDPHSEANRAVPDLPAGSGPVVRLDGGCYVFSSSRAPLSARGALRYCAVIAPSLGSRHQSQFYAELDGGSSPVIAADGRDTVLFVYAGTGELQIGSRRFAVGARDGAYIRPTEAYRLHHTGSAPLRVFISNGPCCDDLAWLEALPDHFEAEHPNRVAQVDAAQRQRMAERHFQMLIHGPHGSTLLTQFIGNIPQSKAEPHRHLYEEALIFLNGHGMVWTEHGKTAVAAGDVLFLPSKQAHSVQCTTRGGFDVVGVIYPGDNPAISY